MTFMNIGTAYNVFSRMEVLHRHGVSNEEILENIRKKFPELKKCSSLEEIAEKVSVAFKR